MSQPKRSYALRQFYHYDAVSRLVAVQLAGEPANRRFYSEGVWVNGFDGSAQRSELHMGGQLAGRREQASDSAAVRLFAAQQQGSVLKAIGAEAQQSLAYTPHGAGADPALPGFNGEQPDPLTGNYLLGNGYRAYNPVLLRFHSPDSFSPFSGGGLNAYTYCLGDPVNRADPTGHVSWRGAIGIGIGLLTLGYGGYSLAFGGLSFSTGMIAASSAAVVSGASGLASVGVGIALTVMEEIDPESEAVGILGWIANGLDALSTVSAISTGVLTSRVLKGYSPSNPTRHSSSESLKTARLQRVGAAPLEMLDEALFGNIARLLPGDDLVNLSLASRRMSQQVQAGIRSLDEALDAAAVRRYRAILGGLARGSLPSQVSQSQRARDLALSLPDSENPAQEALRLSTWKTSMGIRAAARRNSHS